VGQAKRNGQSRRYRERIKTLKPTEPKAVNEIGEGNHSGRVFSSARATGRATTSTSPTSGEVPSSAFVVRRAGARWSE